MLCVDFCLHYASEYTHTYTSFSRVLNVCLLLISIYSTVQKSKQNVVREKCEPKAVKDLEIKIWKRQSKATECIRIYEIERER